MSARQLVAIACAGLGAASLLFAVPAAAVPAQTRVISSCTSATIMPHNYVLSCADANTGIRHATYRSWTLGSASGRGEYYYNTCVPNCAAGTIKHHPVQFTLGRVRLGNGPRLFTRMYVSYAGLTETFALPTSTI